LSANLLDQGTPKVGKLESRASGSSRNRSVGGRGLGPDAARWLGLEKFAPGFLRRWDDGGWPRVVRLRTSPRVEGQHVGLETGSLLFGESVIITGEPPAIESVGDGHRPVLVEVMENPGVHSWIFMGRPSTISSRCQDFRFLHYPHKIRLFRPSWRVGLARSVVRRSNKLGKAP